MKIDKREKLERNLEIYEKKKEGASWTELSKKYGMSNAGLQNIYRRHLKREVEGEL